jgi:HlyD family secretion protein
MAASRTARLLLLVVVVFASGFTLSCDKIKKIGQSLEGNAASGANYEFTTLSRGTVYKTVSAVGVLNPIATVDIISQISGKAVSVLVDFNDEVHKGDLLVELNTETLQLQRQQLQAQVTKARSALDLVRVNYQNQLALAEQNLISQYELKQTKNQLDASTADLSIAESNLKVKETEINQYSLIKSPVDGTILDRNVNAGETVVEGASANSKPIFTIAENLREMQIEAWVGELDIGSIHNKQDVRFTLEALPGKTLYGSVTSVRLSPQTQDGVVSYKVIVSAENADMALLPGMTCELEFIEDARENVYLIPNAALRYSPSSLTSAEAAALIAAKTPARTGSTGPGAPPGEDAPGPGAPPSEGAPGPGTPSGAGAGAPRGAAGTAQSAQRQPQTGGAFGGLLGGTQGVPSGSGGRARRAAQTASDTGQTRRQEWTVKQLWFVNKEGGKPDCVVVRAGLSDGVVTEVESSAFTEDFIAAARFIVRERVR